MVLARPVAIALLCGLTIAAHFSLSRQAENNGTFPHGGAAGIFKFSTRTLPNTTIPIRIPQTGIAALDNYLAFMVFFFHATLDPRNVRAHLQGHPLLGTLSSIWLLMLAETHRPGRSAAFVFVTYFSEVMGELLGIGMFTPVWCAVHLVMTSAPALEGRGDGGGFRALGWAVVLGHVVPTVMMVHCQPDGDGLWNQQIWTVLRLFHPVFVFVLYKVLTLLLGLRRGKSDSGPRTFYTFSILASGFFHVSAMGLLMAQHWMPGWIRDEVSAAIDFAEILVPYPYWQDTVPKVVPFEIGVATFLQWDNLLSATAILIWAAALYIEATALSRMKTGGESLHVIIQAAGVTILAGPAAAAAFFMQERDSTMASVENGSSKKRQ